VGFACGIAVSTHEPASSEDGRVVLNDGRAGNRTTRAQGTLQQACEFVSVQYHPTIPHLFLTGDKLGSVCVRDVRMAFGPIRSRTNDGIVREVGFMSACLGVARH
jgi:DDB1- and CUL4-associated factor 5